jgi:hypothetical protein
MIIAMVLVGILSGAGGVAWALSAGLSLMLVLLAYPVAGVLGSVVFLTLAMRGQTAPELSRHMPAVAKA